MKKLARILCASATATLLFGAGGTASAQTLSIGAVIPLTGTSGTIGEDQRRGAMLAVDQINADKGVLGKKLKLIVEDAAGSASVAVSAARKLVSVNKVPIVLGAYSSGVTIPVGEYVVRQGAVHINVGSSSPALRKVGEGSFSVIGLDNLSAKFAASDVLGLGLKSVAFIAPNNAYGQDVADEFKKRYEAAGGKVTSLVLYTEGQSTYRRELQQMSRTNPQGYVYTAYGQDSATINREAYELGLNKSRWYGIYLTMCTSDTLPQAAQGQVGLEVASVGEDGKRFEEAYQKKYNEAPKTTFSSYMYDGIMVAAAAINKAGSADPQKIRAAMRELGTYHGVTGNIAFDEQGQRIDQPYDKVQYKDKTVVPR